MTEHDLIRKAVMFSLSVTGERGYTHDDYDAAMAALDALVARANQIEKALGLLGGAVELHHNYGNKRYPGCGVCDALANAEAALAGVPAGPATEEKP